MKSNNIRLFREIKGYSQKYVATRLGKSQAAYSKIENGHTLLSNELIEQINKILEVPKNYLFGEENYLIQNINGPISQLLKELSENRKLLREVELNQQKITAQLNMFLAKTS